MAITKVKAGQVTSKLNATGSTIRGLDDKLAEFVSVKDFGAVGDGVADDTAAIQAALSSGASEVRFPSGTFVVSSTLTAASNQTLTGVGTSTIIKLTANASLFDQTTPVLLKKLRLDVYDQGNAYTGTVVRIKTSTVLQGLHLVEDVSFWANTTSTTATAYALECISTGYIAFNTVSGLITRGSWGVSIEIKADLGGAFIQGNTFTGLNLTSKKFVNYTGTATEVYGNQLSGVFQAEGGSTVIQGSYFGPVWDMGVTNTTFDPKFRSLMVCDISDGLSPLVQSSPTKGVGGWTQLTARAFVQNGYLRDFDGSSQVAYYENDNFHRGVRGMVEFVDYCQGKEFDNKITLTNMTATPVAGGQGGVLMPTLRTSESVTGAWMGLTNTGCALSKFPTLVMHVKVNNRSGNTASAFQNTTHCIGLLDTNAMQNGVRVRREWVSGTAWNNYLEVVAAGVTIYSQIINRNGTATPITTGLQQTDRFKFWVDNTNIYFEMTYEAFNQAGGTESYKRAGVNLWSGVMTIPLSTAGMFSTTAIELNPLYVATPATFDADQLRLQWKRIEFRHTQY
jgi:hypothetical protein